MKKIVTGLLLVLSLFIFVSNNLFFADAKEICEKCTDEIKCEEHDTRDYDNNDEYPLMPNAVEGNGGLIEEEDNPRGGVLFGYIHNEETE